MNYITRQALLVAMTVCTAWSPHHVWAISEEETVQRVITDMASAVTAFPTTRDRHSVLKYFAKEFSSIDDAERGSLQTVEHMLADIEEGPSFLKVTERISNIVVHLTGNIAWSTYDDVLTIQGEQMREEDMSVCTAILTKTETKWLYLHEHCSLSQSSRVPQL